LLIKSGEKNTERELSNEEEGYLRTSPLDC